MNPEPESVSDTQTMPPQIERLLVGLWQQREELGLIADELLAVFRRYGLNPPQDGENEP